MVQAKCLVAERHFEIRFKYEDENNYAAFIVWPNTPPHIPCGTWELRQVIAGISALIDSGNLDQFDLDVYYVWRVIHKIEGTNVVYQAYQDENLLSYQVVVKAWGSDYGTIMLVTDIGGEVHVEKVKVSEFPMESDFIGPS